VDQLRPHRPSEQVGALVGAGHSAADSSPEHDGDLPGPVWGIVTSMTAEASPFPSPIVRQDNGDEIVFTWSTGRSATTHAVPDRVEVQGVPAALVLFRNGVLIATPGVSAQRGHAVSR
jgi:hypothetical protein